MATEKLEIVGRRANSVMWFGVPVLIFGAFIWRIFSVEPALRFSDDFFYYVVTSSNWVDGAGSTFFPGEPTNGYHPFWFLWMALLHWIGGSGSAFFALIDLSIAALLVGFFFQFGRFLRNVTGNSSAAAAGATTAVITMAVISMAGLETALAAFAAAVLLAYLTRKPLGDNTIREATIVGFLASLVVLARLDAALLVLCLAAVVLPRWNLRRVSAFAVGAVPLYIYLAANVMIFGHLGTTSMVAKSLGVYWPPNLWFIAHPSAIVGAVVMGAVVATSGAVVLMSKQCKNSETRWIVVAVAVVPIVQLVVQATLSGWTLFPWYFYFFFITLGQAVTLFVVALSQRGSPRRVGIPLASVGLVVLGIVFVGGLSPDKWQVDITAIAKRVQAFSANHPGVYAMGDAAGTPAWMMHAPIVHLEGLMMSHDFLDRIRDRETLQQVFRDYHVTYYVTVRTGGDDPSGCRRFTEPNAEQASPRAPHLSMVTCSAPIEEFDEDSRYRVQIFQIDPKSGDVVQPTAS